MGNVLFVSTFPRLVGAVISTALCFMPSSSGTVGAKSVRLASCIFRAACVPLSAVAIRCSSPTLTSGRRARAKPGNWRGIGSCIPTVQPPLFAIGLGLDLRHSARPMKVQVGIEVPLIESLDGFGGRAAMCP